MRLIAFTAWAARWLAPLAYAQDLLHKEPAHYTGTERASRVEVRPPGNPARSWQSPRVRSSAIERLRSRASFRAGHPAQNRRASRPPRCLPAAGEWETTTEGTRVWR